MAMKQPLQEILASLAARQREMEKANAEMKAVHSEMEARTGICQENSDTEAKVRHGRMEAAMHSMRSDTERSVQKQMEDVLSVLDHKTQSLQMDLTEKFKSTQVKLETIELSLGVETNNLRLDLSNLQAETISNRHANFERIEAVRREFHTRLEEAKEMAGHANGKGSGTCAATAPNFDGTASWSVFRHQFETIAEHNGWKPKEKSTYLITALEARATDVLHGIPKGASYDEILQALEDCFGKEPFAALYRSQLKVRTQKAGESL
jgi:hypothetical protein